MPTEFTLISPMYNVARFLPEYFASLERQTYGFERLEVILVDDGSEDETAALAEEFAYRHTNVRVIRKENGGQASARNTALPFATGTWLAFPDPDDTLSDNYCAVVSAAIDHQNPPAILSARLLLWFDADNQVKDTHALAGRFRQGPATKSLVESPSWIQPHITSGFVRRDVVEAANLIFPEDLRLRFEDGAFVSRYLLQFDDPTVTFLPDAEYLYRQRSDNSSTIQSSSANPAKYTDTIRRGFLPVIENAMQVRTEVPRWLQNLFLYDQFWILRASQSPAVRNARFPETMYDELDDLLPAFLQHIDDAAITEFNIMYVAPWMREALLLTKRGGGVAPVYWGAEDRWRGLRSIIYRFRGGPPIISLLVNGVPTEPLFQKALGLEYAARPIVMQQSMWVPVDSAVKLSLDGQLQKIHDSPAKVAPAFVGAAKPGARGSRLLSRARKAVERRLRPGGLQYWRRDIATRSSKLAKKFAHAWVFIDRDVDSGDSAEDQYWWMKAHHPEINSWFVVRQGTRDWLRMSAAGARLIGYGTPEFYALLSHADHLASSHADRFITHALPPKMRPPRYVFTFLQHGVIKGDISHWLNPKDIQVFVSSTPDEYRYLTMSPAYRYSTKEVQLTGLPRFDVLKERSDAVSEPERNLILVMPTWRDYLVGPMGKDSADRAPIADFAMTNYARSISEFLNNYQLLSSSRDAGKYIVFMPHPNMQPYLSEFIVPDQVDVRSYAETDVRDLLIHASLLVTDYSSIAFNAAYLRTPVTYFQFDQDEYLSEHTERAGYFEYDQHGFGPVTVSANHAARSVVAILKDGPSPKFSERMEHAFPTRDGQNRNRVYQAMLKSRGENLSLSPAITTNKPRQ